MEHFWFGAGVDAKFTKDLLKESVDVQLICSAKYCKLDSMKKILITHEDARKKAKKKLE